MKTGSWICPTCLVRVICSKKCEEGRLPYKECKILCPGYYQRCFDYIPPNGCNKAELYRRILES